MVAPNKSTRPRQSELSDPKGLVFDCDGTLADTMPLHWRAWQAIAARHNFRFSEDRFYSLGGVPSRDILRLLSQEQGVQLDHLAIAREKEAEYLPLIAQVEPINVVVGVARQYFGRIPMAVASGGSRRAIEHVLNHLNIRQLFDAVVTNEDVVHQKPRRISSSRRPAALGWIHVSVGLTRTLTLECRRFAPPGWKPSTSGL